MKKVFFVAGTGRSGSTLLDLMLGNDEKGFSAGELRAFMRPWRPHHLLKEERCKCGNRSCTFWSSIKTGGEREVYNNIFERKDIEFIVDSSKDHLWLKDQIRYSKNKDYEIIPILIYKEPLEYLYSRFKRNNHADWQKGWIKTHKRLFEVSEDFISVKYRELATNPKKKLKALCSRLGIEYFEGKENFWNNQHAHFLFGSDTVRKSDQLVYYKDQYDQEILRYLRKNFSFRNDTLKQIMKVLDSFEVSSNSSSLKKEKEKLGEYLSIYNYLHRLGGTQYYFLNHLVNNFRHFLKK